MSERLQAYYYSFEPTGCDPVDTILEAVALAGKGHHHTQGWSEPIWGDGSQSHIALIQGAANRAATKLERFRELHEACKELREAWRAKGHGGVQEGNAHVRIDNALAALDAP